MAAQEEIAATYPPPWPDCGTVGDHDHLSLTTPVQITRKRRTTDRCNVQCMYTEPAIEVAAAVQQRDYITGELELERCIQCEEK